MRIFLDANVLFSAARSSGAVRQLVVALHAAGHSLVADEYVAEEARRNVTAKASREAVDYLQAFLGQLEVRSAQVQPISQADVQWLPAKDRPVLLAAIALKCDALVTGDRTHFGAGYEKVFEGVTVYSPAQLALAVFPPHATPT